MRRRLAIAVLLVGVLSTNPANGTSASSASANIQVADHWEAGTWIVQLVSGTNIIGFLESKGIEIRDVSTYENVFTGFSGNFSASEMERISSSPLFVTAEENQLVHADAD